MQRFACPSCGAVVRAFDDAMPVCEECGYGSEYGAVAVTPPERARHTGAVVAIVIVAALAIAGAALALWWLHDDPEATYSPPAMTDHRGRAEAALIDLDEDRQVNATFDGLAFSFAVDGNVSQYQIGDPAILRAVCTPGRLFLEAQGVIVRNLSDDDDCQAVVLHELDDWIPSGFAREALDLLLNGTAPFTYVGATGSDPLQVTYDDGEGGTAEGTVEGARLVALDWTRGDQAATFRFHGPDAITLPDPDGQGAAFVELEPAAARSLDDTKPLESQGFILRTPHEGLPRDRFQVLIYPADQDPTGPAYTTFSLNASAPAQKGIGFSWGPEDVTNTLDDGEWFFLLESGAVFLDRWQVVLWDLDAEAVTGAFELPAPTPS